MTASSTFRTTLIVPGAQDSAGCITQRCPEHSAAAFSGRTQTYRQYRHTLPDLTRIGTQKTIGGNMATKHRSGMLCPTCKTTYHLYNRYASGKCQDCSVKYKNFNFWLIVGLIDRLNSIETQILSLQLSHKNHLKWHQETLQTALTNDAPELIADTTAKLEASLLYL